MLTRQRARHVTALACALDAAALAAIQARLPRALRARVVLYGDLVQGAPAGRYDVVLSRYALEWSEAPLLAHLLSVTRLLRPDGSAVLVTEARGAVTPEPNLGRILMLLREHPVLSRSTRDLRLVEPWTWLRDGTKVRAHAVVFRRVA